MSDRSSIEWTDATWNPVRGCTKISPGCKNCYAATFAERFRGVPGHPLPRIDDLQRSRAVVRFLSIEPLLEDLGRIDLRGISWVIVGGESGPRARPMARDWVISILDQCEEQGVPFFFKQWGGVRKKKTGRQLNGRTYDAMPPVAVAR